MFILNGLLKVLVRHRFIAIATVLILGLPILLTLTPGILVLVGLWMWAILVELKDFGK